jgi:hypothetical protein
MKLKMRSLLVLLIAIVMLNSNAAGSQPEPKGNRLIGHGISEGAVGFGKAFALARDAGLEFIELPFAWHSIETAPGTYGNKNLKIANVFFVD